MRDPWFKAFLVMPPTFCGVRLLPYSVAHDYLLLHLGNPLVCGGDVTEADLFQAISVCSRTRAENRSVLLGDGQSAWLRTTARWVRRWSKRMAFGIAVENFRTYLADYKEVAEHHLPKTPTDPNTDAVAAPLHWHLVHCLCAEYSMTVEQAWDSPFAEAKCMFDVMAETKGDDTLESVLDMHVNDLCREADALGKAGDMEGMEAKYKEVKRLCGLRQAARKEMA